MSNLRFIRSKNKAGKVSYFDKKEQKPATKKEFFKQFSNSTDYPFRLNELFTHELQTLRAYQRIKVGDKFVKKEVEEKIKYHTKTKGIELKNNDAKSLGAEELKKVLETQKTVWKNTEQVLKDMIKRYKSGKAVKVKSKGKMLEGQDAIEAVQRYVNKLKQDAEKTGGKVAYILAKVKQS